MRNVVPNKRFGVVLAAFLIAVSVLFFAGSALAQSSAGSASGPGPHPKR